MNRKDNSFPPEYASVEAFAEDLIDDDRETYTPEEADYLAECLRTSVSKLRKELRGYGLEMTAREVVREVRTFSTSSHDRWYGPGSSATHGVVWREASGGVISYGGADASDHGRRQGDDDAVGG